MQRRITNRSHRKSIAAHSGLSRLEQICKRENEIIAMDIFEIDLTGTGGIAAIDALQRVLKCIGGLTEADETVTGRLIALLPGGFFIHRTITQTRRVAAECKSGRTLYSLVSIVCAAAFVGLVQELPDSWFPFPDALVFRVITLFASWFQTHR